MELCAYGQTDKPQGMLVLCLKFLKFILMDIKSCQVINHQEVHKALLQFLGFIHNSIKNEMIDMCPESEQKREILDFIFVLTTKIYE